MNKTIAQVFDELPDDVKQEIYRIVGWSVERNRVHPIIRQYESGKNGTNLYSCNDWCWFGKLTKDQKDCISEIVKQAAVDKED